MVLICFPVYNAAAEVRRLVHHDRGGRGHPGRPGRGAVAAREQQRHAVRILHTWVRHVHAQVRKVLLLYLYPRLRDSVSVACMTSFIGVPC